MKDDLIIRAFKQTLTTYIDYRKTQHDLKDELGMLSFIRECISYYDFHSKQFAEFYQGEFGNREKFLKARSDFNNEYMSKLFTDESYTDLGIDIQSELSDLSVKTFETLPDKDV